MLPHIIETNSLILEKNDGTTTHPWYDGLSTSTQFLCVCGVGGERAVVEFSKRKFPTYIHLN